MRISTKSIYDTGTLQLNNQQSALSRTQQQLSSDRRILTPSDDPIASARALEVTQSQSMNEQLSVNRRNAINFLGQEEQVLTSAHGLIADVKTLAVNAGNGSLTDADRGSLAVELEGRLTDLIALANSTDGTGNYLFSGFKSTTQPYTAAPAGADYHGDQGQRQLQVGPSRYLPTSDAGSAVFENSMSGNGTFVTGAAAANTGGGIISGGSVTDASALTRKDYTVTFKLGADGKTTFGVSAGGADLLSDQPFVSGQSIQVDGQSFEVTGKPADGDQFTLAPSKKESLFSTLSTLLGVLRAPHTGAAGQASLTNSLNKAHESLDAAYDNVLSVRTDVGTRKKELDYLDSAGDDLGIQYSAALSDLQDLDTIKAMSMFTQQKITLDASQKSFTAMSGLSLFNYIN